MVVVSEGSMLIGEGGFDMEECEGGWMSGYRVPHVVPRSKSGGKV